MGARGCWRPRPRQTPGPPPPPPPAAPEMAGGSVADMFSFEGVAAMLAKRAAVLPAWTHYVVFDLWTARWEVQDALRRGVPQASVLYRAVCTGLVWAAPRRVVSWQCAGGLAAVVLTAAAFAPLLLLHPPTPQLLMAPCLLCTMMAGPAGGWAGGEPTGNAPGFCWYRACLAPKTCPPPLTLTPVPLPTAALNRYRPAAVPGPAPRLWPRAQPRAQQAAVSSGHERSRLAGERPCWPAASSAYCACGYMTISLLSCPSHPRTPLCATTEKRALHHVT